MELQGPIARLTAREQRIFRSEPEVFIGRLDVFAAAAALEKRDDADGFQALLYTDSYGALGNLSFIGRQLDRRCLRKAAEIIIAYEAAQYLQDK
jgi:hypothetical protein